jgi:hypothetical protein
MPISIGTGEINYNSLSDKPISSVESIDSTVEKIQSTYEINGFPNDDSDISFDINTLIFTISPKNTEFVYYNNGTKYVVTEPKSVQLPEDTTGKIVYYVFFEGGVLKESTTPFFFEPNHVKVSLLAYNSDLNLILGLTDKRQKDISISNSAYINQYFKGITYISGFELQNVTLNDGSTDNALKFGMNDGVFSIVDNVVEINHSENPTSEYEVFLTPYAKICTSYDLGFINGYTNGVQHINETTDYVFPIINNKLQYNPKILGEDILADVPNGKYASYFLITTSTLARCLIRGFAYREVFDTLEDAKNSSVLLYGFLPESFAEIMSLYRFIYHVDTGAYTNTFNAALVDVTDLRRDTYQTVNIANVSTHDALANRNTLNSHPSNAISYDNIASGLISNDVKEAIDELASDKLDKNSPITGATKTKITYDADGLVTSGADATTSDISEGTNLYYTDERSQDSIGTILTDTNTIDLVYTDGTPSITANVKYQDSTTINFSDDSSGLKADVRDLTVTQLASGVLDTDLTSVSASDDTIPSAKAIKTALDLKQNILYYGEMFEIAGSPPTTITLTNLGQFYKWINTTAGINSGITHNATTDDLTVNVGSNGVYEIDVDCSALFSRTNATYTMEVFKGGVATGIKSYYRTSNANNMSGLSINRNMNLVANDALDLRFTSSANNDTATVYAINFTIKKI